MYTLPHTRRCGFLLVAAAGLFAHGLFAAGCASTPATEENAVKHVVSEADISATKSNEPMTGSGAVLWINGLGCPQCATNIDLQLKRVGGMQITPADLSTGKVEVLFVGKKKPSPKQLAEAATEAGFTLMKIESK